MMSMTPRKSSATPMGMVTGPRRLPNRACSVAMMTSKSACSRSMWLMNTARDRRMPSASRHSFVVITWGPATASITNRAISAACMVASVSPMKSGCPEVSSRFIVVLVGDGRNRRADGELAADLLVVVVQVGLPVVGGAHARRASAHMQHGLRQEVLPAPSCPTKTILRTCSVSGAAKGTTSLSVSVETLGTVYRNTGAEPLTTCD